MFTLKDASKAIGVPYNSIWEYRKKGKLPIQKIGRDLLIDPEVLRTTLASLNYKQRRKN